MDDAKNGWILDGYPRNASQVEALDAILADLNTPLDAVVALDADHDVLMERMKKRAEIEGVPTTLRKPSPSVLMCMPRKPLRCWPPMKSAGC